LARRELSNGEDNRKALVYRIFEFDDVVKQVPRKKQQLFDLFKKGKAIEFHDRFNKGSHRIPGLSTFFARVENDSTVAVQLIQPYNRHTWEPQFVSLNTIPMHDERFPYGIRDNTVLRWELCRMGYRFLVVTDVFNVHRGIKSASSVNKTRMLQNRVRARFNKAVKAFNLRMDSEYPQTKSLCPPCRAWSFWFWFCFYSNFMVKTIFIVIVRWRQFLFYCNCTVKTIFIVIYGEDNFYSIVILRWRQCSMVIC